MFQVPDGKLASKKAVMVASELAVWVAVSFPLFRFRPPAKAAASHACESLACTTYMMPPSMARPTIGTITVTASREKITIAAPPWRFLRLLFSEIGFLHKFRLKFWRFAIRKRATPNRVLFRRTDRDLAPQQSREA